MSYFCVSDARSRELYADVRKSVDNPTLHILADITIEESAGGVEEKTVHTLCGESIFQGYYLDEARHLYVKDAQGIQENLCPVCLERLDRNGDIWKARQATLLIETIQKKVEPRAQGWYDWNKLPAELVRDPRKKSGLLCPECQQNEVVCCFTDPSAGTENYFNFVHVCLNPGCNHGRHLFHLVQYNYDTADEYQCPFCGRHVLH